MTQITTEIACKDAVFHFNKKHLEDQTIPMWVVKAKGETYYVDHVTCELPWSTKETPKNSHTKGSIKIKKCLLTIDEDNCATLSHLSKEDEERLSGNKKVIRVITEKYKQLEEQLNNAESDKWLPIQQYGGVCSTPKYVAEINCEKLLTLLQLVIGDLRVLMPNEYYYFTYNNDKYDEEDYYY